MKLGETIRVFRIANDYTAKQLSEICGISQAYVTEMENNHKKPSYDMLKRIAAALKIPAYKIVLMHEMSEEGNWSFQKTLLETLKIYVGE